MSLTKIVVPALGLAMAVGIANAQQGQYNPSQRGPVPFNAMDQNRDGVVSAEEHEKMRAERRKARTEQGNRMRNAGDAPSFGQIDLDGDGVASREELNQAQQKRMQQMQQRKQQRYQLGQGQSQSQRQGRPQGQPYGERRGWGQPERPGYPGMGRGDQRWKEGRPGQGRGRGSSGWDEGNQGPGYGRGYPRWEEGYPGSGRGWWSR